MKNITDNEIIVEKEDIIVSTTNTRGMITYANDIFVRISGYTREELMGKPHNILRHPHMPKCVFKYFWMELLAGRSLYAFVKNRAKNGDYYWVKVYAMPILKDGQIEKLISYRQTLNSYAKQVTNNLYALLVDYEKNHSADESLNYLIEFLTQRNLSYNDFIDRLSLEKNITSLEAMNVNYKKFQNQFIINNTKVKDSKNGLSEEILHLNEFNTWIKDVKNQDFTHCSSWRKMICATNQYHGLLHDYNIKIKGNAPPDALDLLSTQIEQSTNVIFTNLQDSIDNFD